MERTGTEPRPTCPSCSGGLVEESHAGVVVDRCVRCSDWWFDAGELERYARAHPVSGHDWRPEPEHGTGATLPCPRCASARLHPGTVETLRAFRCSGCRGVHVRNADARSLRVVRVPRSIGAPDSSASGIPDVIAILLDIVSMLVTPW